MLGVTLLGVVVSGLEPPSGEPVEPEGAEATPLGDPELAVVGLVRLLVGLVKLLVGLVRLLVGLVRLLVGLVVSWLGPVPAAPAAAVPEPAVPEPVLPLVRGELKGAPPLGDVEVAAGPLAAVLGLPAPSDIWITGVGHVENVPNPIAVTPLAPSTLYVIW